LNKLIIAILLLGSFNSFSTEPIIIGSKTFSESILNAEMLAQLLESKGQPVTRKLSLGGTKVAFDALNHGGIHVYPDYTGTGYIMILKMNGERDPNLVHKIVSKEFLSKFDIKWSKTLGFNNTYALTVRASDKKLQYANKISDVSGKLENIRLAAPYEFMERQDGYKGFAKIYNLNFKPSNLTSLNAGLMYNAIRDDQVDMIVSYSTDGRIKAFDLKILKDDINYFPPYQPAFLSKSNSFIKYPLLKESIESLEGAISEAEMIAMNDQVDRLKQQPKAVARNFLIKKGLLKGNITKSQKDQGIIAFMISRKAELMKLLGEHLLLSFVAIFCALLVSVPLGVLLTRRKRAAQIIFPIVNTIQTIPSLALLGFLIPILGIGFAPAVLALFLYSLLPLVRNTYEGIKAVDRNFVEASRGIGLTNLQILFKVEIPLALPIILAGLRTATVIVIGTATLAALIGAGGLGDPIFRGVATVNSNLILLGAIPSALLAITADKLIGGIGNIFISKGIKLKFERQL
jgi:osmoprotectant transport system permease protein